MFFQRCLFNHGWPVQNRASANFKSWAATTAFSVGDTVSLTNGYRVQCKTAGMTGASQPTLGAMVYATDITDGTVVWRLANLNDSSSVLVDTGSTYITFEDCDMTGAFQDGIRVRDTGGGDDPDMTRFVRCTTAAIQNHGFSIDAARRVIIDNCELQQPLGSATTKSGIVAQGAFTGDLIVRGACIASQFNYGIWLTYGSGGTALITGCSIHGLGKGILVQANRSDFVVTGNDLGQPGSWGTNTTSVEVQAGTSDDYIIAHNRINGSGAVLDGGTGANKLVSGNI